MRQPFELLAEIGVIPVSALQGDLLDWDSAVGDPVQGALQAEMLKVGVRAGAGLPSEQAGEVVAREAGLPGHPLNGKIGLMIILVHELDDASDGG